MVIKDKLHILGILILSVIALLPLFQPGFNGYDFVYQGARLASFYKNLTEGVILPRWAGQINSGYGHPVLIFLYPFVFYLGSFWHFFGFSFTDSLKILFGLGFIISGLGCYFLFAKIWGKDIGLASALIYLFTPYRFINMYSRAALGEHMATTFVPFVFLAIWSIVKTAKRNLYNIIFFAVSLAFAILSHNLIILIAFPLIAAFYIFLSVKNPSKSTLYQLFFGFILALGLSSFFWLPVVFERKYTRYDQYAEPQYYSISLSPLPHVVLLNSYQLFRAGVNKLNVSYFPPSISLTQIFLFICGIYFALKNCRKRKRETFFIFFLLLYFAVGVFLASKESFFLLRILPQIAFFQQAFRFLNLPLFATPFLLAFTITLIPLPKRFLFITLFSIFNILLCLPYFFNLSLPRQFMADRYFWQEYNGTADTGQITTKWSFINYFDLPPAKIQLVSGGLNQFSVKKWHSQEHIYTIDLRSDSQIADNTLYFPGWKVYVDGQETGINYQDMNWRGIITFFVPKGNHQITAKFEETKLRLFGDYLSLFSLIILIVMAFYWVIFRKCFK